MQGLFEIKVQNKQKGGTGAEARLQEASRADCQNMSNRPMLSGATAVHINTQINMCVCDEGGAIACGGGRCICLLFMKRFFRLPEYI